MEGKRSRKAALEFLEYVAKKGLMAEATARARKAAVSQVLGILSDDEAQDVTAIDLDSVMTRFGHLHGKSYTPGSLATYKSRVGAALDDFARYVENPLGFKSSVQTRDRKSSSAAAAGNGRSPAEKKVEQTIPSAISASTEGPMASSIVPIPIRPNLTVHVQGLPFDLTSAEAKKIANVVLAMAVVE